jgi:hypothetical protein
VQVCGLHQDQITIYPTFIQNSFTISGLYSDQYRTIQVEVIDAVGKRVAIEKLHSDVGSQTVYLKSKPSPGTYFVILKDSETNIVLVTQKIIISD